MYISWVNKISLMSYAVVQLTSVAIGMFPRKTQNICPHNSSWSENVLKATSKKTFLSALYLEGAPSSITKTTKTVRFTHLSGLPPAS